MRDSRELAEEFIKRRWKKDWQGHMHRSNVEKWDTRIWGVIHGFYYEFRLFDKDSRRVFYKLIKEDGRKKLAEDLAKWMRVHGRRDR